MKRLTILACLALLPGCITARYSRVDRGQPAQADLLLELKAGESTMQSCIDQLGAPLIVRENAEGADLIWGWERNAGLNVSASIPLGKAASGNLSYGRTSSGAQGWTLKFDPEWILVSVHEGRLLDLVAMSSQPPRLPDGDLPE